MLLCAYLQPFNILAVVDAAGTTPLCFVQRPQARFLLLLLHFQMREYFV